MSETKSGDETVYHSENFATIAKFLYDNENLSYRQFRYVCEILAMSNSENLFLKNEIK